MEIILLEDVQRLGYKDDVVKVKNGYGRNYLIPTKKAVIATESAKKVLAEKLKQRAHKLEKIKNDAQTLADKLATVETIVIATKVSPTGVIYGSVNSLQIADKLKEKGFDIDRKKIDVKDVKEIGEYKAVVHLHKEVSVEMPFVVVSEDAKPAPAKTKPVTDTVAPATEAAAPATDAAPASAEATAAESAAETQE